MKKLNRKGFTLTELIVVIAIIGILAAVLIPSLSGYITRAKESAAKQEAAEVYRVFKAFQQEDLDLLVPAEQTFLGATGYGKAYTGFDVSDSKIKVYDDGGLMVIPAENPTDAQIQYDGATTFVFFASNEIYVQVDLSDGSSSIVTGFPQ